MTLGQGSPNYATKITTAKGKKSTRRRRLLISDEAAIHYLRRIDYYATLTERDYGYILHLGVGYIGRRIMLSSFQENDGERSINQNRGIEKRSRIGGSRSDFRWSTLHFPRFSRAIYLYKVTNEIISRLSLVRDCEKIPLLILGSPIILSFARSCLLFPRLIDIYRARQLLAAHAMRYRAIASKRNLSIPHLSKNLMKPRAAPAKVE